MAALVRVECGGGADGTHGVAMRVLAAALRGENVVEVVDSGGKVSGVGGIDDSDEMPRLVVVEGGGEGESKKKTTAAEGLAACALQLAASLLSTTSNTKSALIIDTVGFDTSRRSGGGDGDGAGTPSEADVAAVLRAENEQWLSWAGVLAHKPSTANLDELDSWLATRTTLCDAAAPVAVTIADVVVLGSVYNALVARTASARQHVNLFRWADFVQHSCDACVSRAGLPMIVFERDAFVMPKPAPASAPASKDSSSAAGGGKKKPEDSGSATAASSNPDTKKKKKGGGDDDAKTASQDGAAASGDGLSKKERKKLEKKEKKEKLKEEKKAEEADANEKKETAA